MKVLKVINATVPRGGARLMMALVLAMVFPTKRGGDQMKRRVFVSILACMVALLMVSGAIAASVKLSDVKVRMKELGYDPGVIDNTWNDIVKAAIEKYQTDHKLTITREWDQRTLQSLGLLPASPEATLPSASGSDGSRKASHQKGAGEAVPHGKETPKKIEGKYLIEAIMNGEIERVKKELENGADPNVRYLNHIPLIAAVTAKPKISLQKKTINTVTKGRIVDGRVVVEDVIDNSVTEVDPLMVKIEEDLNIEMAKLLIDAGADVNFTNEPEGYTALIVAAGMNKVKLVKFLVDAGTDVNMHGADRGTALMMAVTQGFVEMTRTLIASGADVNSRGDGNFTPLHYTAQGGNHVAIAKDLLDNGADVNAKDEDGLTPSHIAADHGRMALAEVLLTNGADVNATDKDGRNALMAASVTGHTETVKALLDKGAYVNAKDKDDKTALMFASQNARAETVMVLLVHGADVNAKVNKHGATALMFASWTGHTETVRALVDNGADVNAKDKDGKTALILASLKGYTEIVQLLKKAGAKE